MTGKRPALALPPVGHVGLLERRNKTWFFLAIVAVWWIFLLTKVLPMVSGVNTAAGALGWVLAVMVCGLIAVVSTVVTLHVLWLPGYIRCYLIGWPMTMEVVDG
ncbi:MAG: hypothetical protein HY567_01405 [Candidatus Kerfeldbacteria bacterium]|nr:hypothetical protein [Candidatus Kerfeldbacteria bacterium]